jgi:MFS family permease
LKFYRGVCRHTYGDNLDIIGELDLLLASLNFGPSKKFSLRDLADVHARKAIIFGVVLVTVNQLCGFFAMLNFTSTIFQASGSTLSPEVSSIIVGIIQVIGAIVCTFLVERAGRRLLLAVSSFGMAASLAVLSLHTFASTRDWEHIPFVTLVSFSLFIFIAYLGVATLPFLYISEIVPTKIKGFTMILCLSVLYICASLVIEVSYA